MKTYRLSVGVKEIVQSNKAYFWLAQRVIKQTMIMTINNIYVFKLIISKSIFVHYFIYFFLLFWRSFLKEKLIINLWVELQLDPKKKKHNSVIISYCFVRACFSLLLLLIILNSLYSDFLHSPKF